MDQPKYSNQAIDVCSLKTQLCVGILFTQQHFISEQGENKMQI